MKAKTTIMINRKIGYFIAVFCMTVSLSTFAQKGGHRGPSQEEVEAKIEEMATDLNLTGDKRDEFVSIEKEFFEDMKVYREARKGRESMETLANAKNEQMKNLLSASEYELYEAKMDELKAQRQERRSH